MKSILLCLIMYLGVQSSLLAQTVWVPVYQPQPAVVQLPPPVVVMQKELVPVYYFNPYVHYGWTPCWRRWWCPQPQYQWVYVPY
jgi:hypothetical protein